MRTKLSCSRTGRRKNAGRQQIELFANRKAAEECRQSRSHGRPLQSAMPHQTGPRYKSSLLYQHTTAMITPSGSLCMAMCCHAQRQKCKAYTHGPSTDQNQHMFKSLHLHGAATTHRDGLVGRCHGCGVLLPAVQAQPQSRQHCSAC